jgi:RNA polymerase sigma-70 factor, ECF subfamily
MEKIEEGFLDRNSESFIQSETEKLILPHRKAMYVRALQLCQDPDTAEDLVQDTFFLGIKYLNQLKDRSKSKFWLSIILRNQFFKECARNKKIESWNDTELSENQIDEKLPEDDLFENQYCEGIRFLVESLGDRLKTPLKMFHFQNLSYMEISTKLDIPIGTVMSRISRARRHLKLKLLDEQGFLN